MTCRNENARCRGAAGARKVGRIRRSGRNAHLGFETFLGEALQSRGLADESAMIVLTNKEATRAAVEQLMKRGASLPGQGLTRIDLARLVEILGGREAADRLLAQNPECK